MAKATKPIPEGFHTITPYIAVQGAGEAITFYEKAFGAEEIMPVTDMFWGDRFGKVRDPYGQEWSIATAKETLTPEEIDTRAKAFFAEMAKKGGC